MTTTVFLKDPEAVLDYVFDWTDWLEPLVDTIATRVVTVPAGITKESDAITEASKSVTVWLSGGTAGASYDVECKITTAAARIDERTMRIIVRER